jgi:hypothetical protein
VLPTAANFKRAAKNCKENLERKSRHEKNRITCPARNKKNFRSTKSGAGMTRAGVAAYRRKKSRFKIKKQP